MNVDYSLFFRAMQPESLLVEAALAVIVLDLTVMRRKDLRARLNVASLIGALATVLAAVFAWALLHEPLSALQAAGGLVVLGGIYLAHRGSR